MMAATHVLTGVATYVGISTLPGVDLPVEIATVAAASLGSLAPDIDDPRSWIGRRLFFISAPLLAILGHRGFTHSLIAAVLVTAGLSWYFSISVQAWAAAFLIGYLVHLAGDWSTGGVPLLWPAERRFRAPWAFRVGGMMEKAFFFGLSLFLGWQAKDFFLTLLQEFKL